MSYHLQNPSLFISNQKTPIQVMWTQDSYSTPQILKSGFPRRFYNDLNEIYIHFISPDCKLRERGVIKGEIHQLQAYQEYCLKCEGVLSGLTGHEDNFESMLLKYLKALSCKIEGWQGRLYAQFVTTPNSEKGFAFAVILAFLVNSEKFLSRTESHSRFMKLAGVQNELYRQQNLGAESVSVVINDGCETDLLMNQSRSGLCCKVSQNCEKLIAFIAAILFLAGLTVALSLTKNAYSHKN